MKTKRTKTVNMAAMSDDVRRLNPSICAGNGIKTPNSTLADTTTPADTEPAKKRREMTETEKRFAEDMLCGVCWLYEGVTFRIGGGCRYTPDFIVLDGCQLVCYEVKGAYRLPSHGRARLAFLQARETFAGVVFRWFELDARGEWVEKYTP